MVKETIVFALTSSTDLASKIAKELGLALGKIKVEHFADGEIMVTPQEIVRGRSVFIIQSTCRLQTGFRRRNHTCHAVLRLCKTGP